VAVLPWPGRVVLRYGVHMAVALLSGVMVGLRCAALVVTSQSGAATVARITVADGGMVPVPSLLGWQSVPPLVPQQPPHIIIIIAVTPRITVRHLTSSIWPMTGVATLGNLNAAASRSGFYAFGVDCFCSYYYRYLVSVRWS
jgi:hypothetical protein